MGVVPQLPDPPQAEEDSKKPSEIKESSPEEEKFLSIQELGERIPDGAEVEIVVGGVVVGRARVVKKA